MFDKSVTDLQSDIVVGTKAITGTLKYISDYSSAGYTGDEKAGNFLVLHFDTNDDYDTMTVELVGGVHGEQTLDPTDNLCIFRVTDPSTQKIRVKAIKDGIVGGINVYDLTGLTLATA